MALAKVLRLSSAKRPSTCKRFKAAATARFMSDFHALRHSFTSGLANAGVAPELRMKLTGHSSERVHRGYSHHDMEVLKAAMAKLPSLNS
jgi:integrase